MTRITISPLSPFLFFYLYIRKERVEVILPEISVSYRHAYAQRISRLYLAYIMRILAYADLSSSFGCVTGFLLIVTSVQLKLFFRSFVYISCER